MWRAASGANSLFFFDVSAKLKWEGVSTFDFTLIEKHLKAASDRMLRRLHDRTSSSVFEKEAVTASPAC